MHSSISSLLDGRMQMCWKRGWVYTVLSLWFLVLLCGHGQAQQPSEATVATPTPTPGPITMVLGSPLALTDKPLSVQASFGRWFPVAVTLSNRGEPVQGTLSLRLYASGGSEGSTSRFESKVDLPTIALKRIWIYGRLERAECDTVEVSLQGRGFTTVSQRFALRMLDSPTRLVLTISDADERLSYLGGLRGPGLGVVEKNTPSNSMPGDDYGGDTGGETPVATNQRLIQPLGVSHEMVPDRWIGFDALHTIVLHDFAHNTLTEAQLAALRGFVAAGGELIVPGGANWQRLAQSPLADLWPIKPVSSSTATLTETTNLVNRFVTISPSQRNGADRLGGAPVVLLRGALQPNAQLFEGAHNSPMVGSLRYGAGYVRMLAFDPTRPPFLGWSGNTELWRRLFENTRLPNRIDGVDSSLQFYGYNPNSSPYAYQQYNNGYDAVGEGVTGNLLQQIIQTPQLRTPPVSYIAWFLALYVFVLVPVNYCILRFFDRREWAWVTVPIIVVAFSAVSYAAALRIKGNMVRTRLVNIVQGSQGPGQARVDSMLWLFSPRRGSFSVQGTDASMTVADYMDAREDSGQGATIRQPFDSSFVVQDFPINMWDWKTFVGQSVIDLKKGVQVKRDGAQLLLTNGTPYHLRGCVLAIGGAVRRFGDVESGKSARTQPVPTEGTLSDPSATGSIIRESHLSEIFQRQAGNNFDNIAQATLSLALKQRGSRRLGDEPMLIAWGEKALAPLRVEGEDPHSEEMALFVLRLPNDASFQTADAGEAAWMPGRLVSSRADDDPNLYGPGSRPNGYAPPPPGGGGYSLPPGSPAAKWKPRNHYYDFELPRLDNGRSRSEIKLSVRGTWYRSRSNRRVNLPVKVSLWDFNRQYWVPISDAKLNLTSGNSNAFAVRLQTQSRSSFVRSPDPLIKLRITTQERTARLQSAVLESR